MTAMVLDRRDLIKGAGAPMLCCRFPAAGRAQATGATGMLTSGRRIASDGRVTLILSQSEIGQGISTTLPAILADELGADWSRIIVENAPIARADISPYQ